MTTETYCGFCPPKQGKVPSLTLPTTNSCSQKNPERSQFVRNIEKVSAIALGVFAAYTNFQLFLSFFIAGIAVGIYQSRYCPLADRIAGCAVGACGQIMDQLTGYQLPYLISLTFGVAIIWEHIHHSPVFNAIVGVGLGNWCGEWLGQNVSFIKNFSLSH